MPHDPSRQVNRDLDKADPNEVQPSHPFTCYNGASEWFRDQETEQVELPILTWLANRLMKTDMPFVLRESGFSGNLNGIIVRKKDKEFLETVLGKELK